MNTELFQWTANQAPLPTAIVVTASADTVPSFVDENDNFSKGVITKYFQSQSYGFVQDRLGRELFFHVDEMDFCGTKNHRKYLTVGAHIGYDVSRTSHGLRIKRIKIY
ncbi:MAG: hypothetical protein COV45_03280 [Deltaproteobacteria bacterium CG11_big_fil_rev_8_21_14_0_20_47_16]|nr:MAG: hypothetical protein COV45_03280 [Deltaproteobacteria bacterium CG11_big_fil_rev_8_21_14_0_20_47_16]